ncbi:transposase [Aquimarina agarivorans]|uniref:transposase n=1 Tax=Aquimarina agarivorans TaxID=980584 RepID=UPI000248F921|nr:transposase [Aquimarina agarivorans]
MELWLKDYRDKGLAGLLIPVKEKQKRTRHVNKEIHEELEKRLNDPRLGFSSYVEALQWVNNTFETSIQYATLRNYMIEFFGTKIKQPRKSHIKKSEEAKVDFLKLT